MVEALPHLKDQKKKKSKCKGQIGFRKKIHNTVQNNSATLFFFWLMLMLTLT
jgi:hypothetical protein